MKFGELVGISVPTLLERRPPRSDSRGIAPSSLSQGSKRQHELGLYSNLLKAKHTMGDAGSGVPAPFQAAGFYDTHEIPKDPSHPTSFRRLHMIMENDLRPSTVLRISCESQTTEKFER